MLWLTIISPILGTTGIDLHNPVKYKFLNSNRSMMTWKRGTKAQNKCITLTNRPESTIIKALQAHTYNVFKILSSLYNFIHISTSNSSQNCGYTENSQQCMYALIDVGKKMDHEVQITEPALMSRRGSEEYTPEKNSTQT